MCRLLLPLTAYLWIIKIIAISVALSHVTLSNALIILKKKEEALLHIVLVLGHNTAA